MAGAPLLIQDPQGIAVVHVLAAVEQGGDALRIDLQRGHLLPEALGHARIGQLELGCRQLTHQQEHQLLLLAFGKGAREPLAESPLPVPTVHTLDRLLHRCRLQLRD